MDSNRIINLGAPVDPNDAARLIDVQTGGQPIDLSDYAKTDLSNVDDQDFYNKGIQSGLGTGGGSGGPVDWSEITNKPSTFPPTTPIPQGSVTNLVADLAGKAPTVHTHTSSQVTDLQEAVEDIIGASLVAGSNVTIGYNDATGKTTINATAGGGGTGGAIKPLSDYGTLVDDGVTDNKLVFDAAQADADHLWIYIPEGTYATSNLITDLTKHYWGPGKVKLLSGDNALLPGRFNTIDPAVKGGLGPTGWFGGDTKGTDHEYIYIPNLGSRKNVDAEYYDGATIPKNVWMYNYAGWSGSTAHLASQASVGATTATLKVVAGGSATTAFSVGDTVGFTTDSGTGGPNTEQTYGDIVTITGVTTNQITFTPALTNTYPLNSIVSHGPRTQHTHSYRFVRNYGGGDAYVDLARTQQNYQLKDTQLHWVEGSTTGLYGGDAILNQNGTYATGWEVYYGDNGSDVTVAAQVDTFVRTNDTGARGATWMGILLKSEGSRPSDAAYIVRGNWRVGLDMTGADFSSNGQSAVQLASGQRIVLDASQDPQNGRGTIGGGLYGVLWGNVQGNSYIAHGTDGTSEYVDIFAGGTYRLRIRGNGTMAFNGGFSVPAGADITGGRDIVAMRDLAAIDRIRIGMLNSPVYFFWDGTNLRATKNAQASSVIIV